MRLFLLSLLLISTAFALECNLYSKRSDDNSEPVMQEISCPSCSMVVVNHRGVTSFSLGCEERGIKETCHNRKGHEANCTCNSDNCFKSEWADEVMKEFTEFGSITVLGKTFHKNGSIEDALYRRSTGVGVGNEGGVLDTSSGAQGGNPGAAGPAYAPYDAASDAFSSTFLFIIIAVLFT